MKAPIPFSINYYKTFGTNKKYFNNPTFLKHNYIFIIAVNNKKRINYTPDQIFNSRTFLTVYFHELQTVLAGGYC